MTLFRHKCWFCGLKSREVEFIPGDADWQCIWQNRAECQERRWQQHPWERRIGRPETEKENTPVQNETIIELSNEQSIQILEGAKELLGPNGENWAKGCWFGRKSDDYSFVSEEGAWKELEGLTGSEAASAEVWCIMGAVEEAAYRLGIVPQQEASERLSAPISLRNLVRSKEKWKQWNVVDVNDAEETTWDDIKELIDERLAELRA